MPPSPSEDKATFAPVAVRTVWFRVVLFLFGAVALAGPMLLAYEAYGYSTFAYRVRPDGLEVRYGFIRLRIPAGEIEAVTLVEDPGRLRREEGVGLPGVQRGWWTVEGQGRVYRLTTASRNVVFVDTAPDATVARPGTRYMFSPAEPGRFVALLEAARRGEAAERGLGEEGVVFPPATSGRHPATDPAMFFLLAEFVIVGAIPLLIWHGRRSLQYRVTAEGIFVRHLFGEHRFGWSGIRDVRRVDPPVGGLRLLGAALPGYYAGSFHLRGLGDVSVYATDLRRGPLVLIEHRPGGKVLISPADADGFLAAVNRYRP